MIYGSICSGIEAATAAWHPLGWEPSFFSEIDAFPRAVLSHHYPKVPLHGDFTTIEAGQYRPIDLLVGGTPCQSFSVAGKRLGLDDPRGNLAIEYCRLALRLRPRWVVRENVPGVLSSNGGRDFGAFLGLLAECGYGFAYRVLDAQYVRIDGYAFALPQKRRRVIVVGYLGDYRRAAGVLFEPESMPRDKAPPRREICVAPEDGAACRGTWWDGGQVSQTLDAVLYKKQALPEKQRFPAVIQGSRVRFLTPRECERLMGFPDRYTDIPWRGRNWTPDGPRYKALGNSMAVNVMRWIGRRIEAAEACL